VRNWYGRRRFGEWLYDAVDCLADVAVNLALIAELAEGGGG
jgi:hypothetical protein